MCSCGKGKQATVESMVSLAGSTLPQLKMIQCAFPTQFAQVFAQVGINGSEQNLPLLAKALQNGTDKTGQAASDSNGNPIKFDIMKQLSLIDGRYPENNSCSM